MFDIPINEPVSISSDYPALMCGIVEEVRVIHGDAHHGSYIHMKVKKADYYISFDEKDDECIIIQKLLKSED